VLFRSNYSFWKSHRIPKISLLIRPADARLTFRS
jgi:hypothetical protein